MTFTFAPAVRDRVGLIIGLAGTTGSGKTLSALKIARGLAGGDDSKIAFIDTERGRGKHYAPAPGEAAAGDRFGFHHGDLKAPFQPETYLAAIHAADAAGYEVIVIDSFSHVWDGEGGLQDMHDRIVGEMVERKRQAAQEKNWRFDEVAEAEKASLTAWKEPKMRHKRLVGRMLQCRAHLIICMRADEKMRIETVEEPKQNGRGTYRKTVIVAPKDMPDTERWVPIVEKRLPYELTLSLVLTPARPGFPVPIKLQAQHRAAVPLDQPLSEETGRALAEWARGGSAEPKRQPQTSTFDPEAFGLSENGWRLLSDDARAAAEKGPDELRRFRHGLSAQHDKALASIETELDEIAADAAARDGLAPIDEEAA